MKRLLLFVCAMFVGTAFADPTNTSNSFPINELMQPDYRYLNSAIYPNTGVYDGDVTVNAMYDWDLFSPTAGNYLPANSTTITTCTSGSFCGGATNIHYDSIDQGITSCSTLGDNSYTQSAAGSSLETDCYKNCTVANANIAHATNVSGNDYYGNGTDTCSATACEGGYHTDNNACGANVLTIHWANSENPNTTCTYGGSITTPATAPTIPGKTFVGWAFVDYTPVEYIKFCTTCYINTQKQIGSNFEIYITMQPLNIDLHTGYGILDNTSNTVAPFSITSYSSTCYGSVVGGISKNGCIHWPGTNTKFTIGISPQWVQHYDNTRHDLLRPYSSNDNLIVGNIHREGGTYPMQVYNVQMYNNGLLDLDLIPVKDANGVACMYDRVGKRFYYNAGTGNFIAGPNL